MFGVRKRSVPRDANHGWCVTNSLPFRFKRFHSSIASKQQHQQTALLVNTSATATPMCVQASERASEPVGTACANGTARGGKPGF